MKRLSPAPLLLAAAMLVAAGVLPHGARADQPPPTRIYVVDVGHGNCVFVVAPSGEVMMLDAGPTRTADRVLKFMEQNDIRKIDYLLVSHFEDDHMGSTPRIAEKVPVGCFVDHDRSIVYGKDDNWWRQRRGPWFREGMGKQYDQSFDVYCAARAKSRHLVVKPGDRVPIKGLDVDVVCAAGKVITQPLEGGGQPNPACAAVDRRSEDDAEDGQCVGVVVRSGKFRCIDLGDLTWNTANKLFCPKNLIGPVDAYVITHHAQSLPKEMGDYYYGLSSCPPSEVQGFRPRVAILTLGGLGHKGGTPDAMKEVRGVPGLDLWETEFIREGGEKGQNGPEQQIASLGQPSDKVPYIALAANADGSFTTTNSRNSFTKKYPPLLPVARLTQLTLRVGDIEKAREFYGKAMGFKEAFPVKDSQGQAQGACFKVADDQFLEFLPAAAGQSEFRLERVSLLTPEIRQAQQVLRERGIAGRRHPDRRRRVICTWNSPIPTKPGSSSSSMCPTPGNGRPAARQTARGAFRRNCSTSAWRWPTARRRWRSMARSSASARRPAAGRPPATSAGST